MKLFVMVAFWIGVLSFAIRIILLSVASWPRQREPQSLGAMVAETILGIAFTVWAGIALWI